VSLVLIDHSQHVCSFYDANEAQEIEEISLLFFVYNLSATIFLRWQSDGGSLHCAS
jgi:hypothetical protein